MVGHIASCLLLSGTRPNGIVKLTTDMFKRREYDPVKEKYHIRLSDHKSNQSGGAAPLCVDDNLMDLMQQYDKIAKRLFPHRGLFFLTAEGKELKWTDAFIRINR